MKKLRKAVLPVLAAVMVFAASAAPSASYFTTYVTAEGGHILHAGDVRVIPHEQVTANAKNITIENTGEEPCYVRAKAVYSDMVSMTYSGAGWTDGGDGWMYYGEIVPVGGQAGALVANLTFPSDTTGIEEGHQVSVTVVSECAKVLYHEDGTPYAAWDLMFREG